MISPRSRATAPRTTACRASRQRRTATRRRPGNRAPARTRGFLGRAPQASAGRSSSEASSRPRSLRPLYRAPPRFGRIERRYGHAKNSIRSSTCRPPSHWSIESCEVCQARGQLRSCTMPPARVVDLSSDRLVVARRLGQQAQGLGEVRADLRLVLERAVVGDLGMLAEQPREPGRARAPERRDDQRAGTACSWTGQGAPLALDRPRAQRTACRSRAGRESASLNRRGSCSAFSRTANPDLLRPGKVAMEPGDVGRARSPRARRRGPVRAGAARSSSGRVRRHDPPLDRQRIPELGTARLWVRDVEAGDTLRRIGRSHMRNRQGRSLPLRRLASSQASAGTSP